MKTSIYCSEKEEIVNLFVGKSVTKITNDMLLLSDGTVLQIIPNRGGCSCGGGDYYISDLNGVENIITNVEVIDIDRDVYSYTEYDSAYEIFVLAGDRRINLLRVEGDDGSGYYGTGYWIRVLAKESTQP
jgi:hypothetical protein